MTLWLSILIFIASCLVLVRSGIWVVQALSKIAQFLKWREFIVASILMAFTTSLPELFIGVTSSFHQKPQLSFGDIIGANIIALTLVIGIGAILAKGLRFEGKILQRSSLYAAFIAPLPLLLMMDGKISRIDGVILFLAFGLYFYRLLSQEERFSKILSNSFNRDRVGFKLFLKDLGIFLGGVFLLLISAEGIVFSASSFAAEFNLPLVIIGAFLVALGTSLPELTFGIRSITMGHREMILGDVMGSVVINSTLILGLVALICPFEIANFSPYFIGIIFTVAAALFFTIFSRTSGTISKREAIFLILIYITFILFEILTQI
jgi:cation:H+ antiporter